MKVISSKLENIIEEETKKFLSELKMISEGGAPRPWPRKPLWSTEKRIGPALINQDAITRALSAPHTLFMPSQEERINKWKERENKRKGADTFFNKIEFNPNSYEDLYKWEIIVKHNPEMRAGLDAAKEALDVTMPNWAQGYNKWKQDNYGDDEDLREKPWGWNEMWNRPSTEEEFRDAHGLKKGELFYPWKKGETQGVNLEDLDQDGIQKRFKLSPPEKEKPEDRPKPGEWYDFLIPSFNQVTMETKHKQLENIVKKETKKFLSELKMISEESDIKKFIGDRRASKSEEKTDTSWIPDNLFYPWQSDEQKFSNELKKLRKMDPEAADVVQSLAHNVKDPAWWNKPNATDPGTRGKVNLLRRLGFDTLAGFVDEYDLGPTKLRPDLGTSAMTDSLPGITGKMSRALSKAGYDPATPKQLQMRRDIRAAKKIKDDKEQAKREQVKDWRKKLEMLGANDVLNILDKAKGAVKGLAKPKEPSFLDKALKFNPMRFKMGGFEE